MKFYRRWVADYQADTAALSLIEHGAYTLMLDHCYFNSGPLPADKAAIYRLCRAFERVERSAIDSVLEKHFTLSEDGYHNARADAEIARNQEYSEAQRERSALGVAARTGITLQPKKGNGAHPPDDSPLVATLPLIDGTEYEVRQAFVAQLEPLYPLVDIPSSLPLMKGWLISKPERRKTRRGIKAFITSWLAKEQTDYAAQDAAKR